jgi:hypothetical protein
VYNDFKDQPRQLVEIHAAPDWLRRAIVDRMVSEGMTVEATRKAVAGVKDAPEWADHAARFIDNR